MTAIPKSVLKSFRGVAKRLFGRARNDSIWLSIIATAEELVLRSVWNETALEYRVRDQFEPAMLAVQLEQLAACEAKSPEPVSFEPSAEGVTVHWLDRGIPQQTFCPKPPEEMPNFPEKPTQVWTTDAGLLRALIDAAETSDAESSRYALGCICLRGQSGSIAATDGRQLLVQRGCEFPWSADLLIPANPVFRSRELANDGPVTIGASDQHVAIGSASWTVWLPINKDGRFPRIDDNVRPESAAKTRLNLALADTGFLVPRLDSLPADPDCNSPITLDLNGQVTVRAWSQQQPRPLELLLSNSSTSGDPVSVAMNRQYLHRALRLGFEQFLVFDPDTPLQCQDDRRTYVWVPLAKQEAPNGAAEPLRIESPLATRHSSIHHHRIKEPHVTQANPTVGEVPAATAKPAKRCRTVTSKSPVEQAIELRDALHVAARQANELARSLKRQRRQNRLVETTLASLKQLQAAG